MGPLDPIAWSEEGLEGSHEVPRPPFYVDDNQKKLLRKIAVLFDKAPTKLVAVTEQIESMIQPDIAQLMVFVNAANKEDKLYVDFTPKVYPIAPQLPHLAEELWQTVAANR